MTAPTQHSFERRKRTRQPMQREVRYRLLDRRGPVGSGMTMNISSHALAFRGAVAVPAGAAIEVSVSWPAEAGSTLRLRATGVVLRSNGRVIVCTMEDSAFRADEIGEEDGVVGLPTGPAWPRDSGLALPG